MAETLSGQLKQPVSLFGLAPRGVYLAASVTGRAGELLPHPFTHHLRKEAGILSVALVVIRLSPHARMLSGSLPYGVRTFLLPFPASDCPADLAARLKEYSKKC